MARSNPTPTTTQVAQMNITSAEQCARLHRVADVIGVEDPLVVLDLLGYLLGEQDHIPAALVARNAA
jgi:hypothetical protein